MELADDDTLEFLMLCAEAGMSFEDACNAFAAIDDPTQLN